MHISIIFCTFASGKKLYKIIMTDPLEFNFTEFDEYIRQEEPNKKEKASIWNMAIGLQQVDQLKTSSYLHEVAKRNIEGEISMKEVVRLVNRYYESKQVREKQDDDTLGESWDLRSRYLYIAPPKEWSKQPQLIGKSTNSSQKSSQKTENSSQKTGSGSQKSSQKIIELIRANAKITTQQMAEDLGISRRAVAKQIARLQTLSIIRRVGPDKGGYWEVED